MILDTTFSLGRLVAVVVSAVGVAGLVWLARLIAHQLAIPISRNQALLLTGGLISFLLLTNLLRDPLTGLTYSAVIVAGFLGTRWATHLIK
jgi:hypothetical protein